MVLPKQTDALLTVADNPWGTESAITLTVAVLVPQMLVADTVKVPAFIA